MPGGRPSLYKPENAEIAHLACMLGATNEALAERFEVAPRTIDNWIATLPDFRDAVRKGREVADEAVVAALFARATGMKRKMTRVFCHDGRPITVEYIVELPPDVRACIFWLRNRRPGQWRENRPLGDEAAEADLWRAMDEAEERMRLAELDAELDKGAGSTPDRGEALR
jgi:hypothetical protein